VNAPLIGVTSNYTPAKDGKMGTNCVGEAYIQAVLRAGGLPVIIPAAVTRQDLSALFQRLDGLLLTGGGDINPNRFDGAPHPRVYDIDERRDEQEIDLVRMAAENGKPFLGICRGIQVINVALGGTLFTDISDQLPGAFKHDHYPDTPRDYLAHPVSVTPGSKLAKILGGEAFDVNSLHHQGTDRVAAQLSPVAFSTDHLVEAVELPGHPFGLGVQWHPEWLQAYEPQRQLFQALVKAALAQ
jgi:putative glutamine amidotransferase